MVTRTEGEARNNHITWRVSPQIGFDSVLRAGNIVRRIKVPAAAPAHPSPVPRPCMVEEENRRRELTFCELSFDLYVERGEHMWCPHEPTYMESSVGPASAFRIATNRCVSPPAMLAGLFSYLLCMHLHVEVRG